MKLSITATLTEEEVLILAKAKWREETFIEYKWELVDGLIVEWEKIETPNPQTAADFIVSVYQAMIANDATKIFTEYRTQELKKQIAQTESIVKEWVESVIISSIE